MPGLPSLLGFFVGLAVGVFAGFRVAKDKESFDGLLSHPVMQMVMIVALSIAIVFLPLTDIALKLVLVFTFVGTYLLVGLRYVPRKCVGGSCNDVRCDVTIVGLYGRLSFTLILLGGIVAIIWLVGNTLRRY